MLDKIYLHQNAFVKRSILQVAQFSTSDHASFFHKKFEEELGLALKTVASSFFG